MTQSCPHAVRTATGTLTVPATEPVPGLHVYQQPEQLRGAGDGTTHPWRLGHHSGRPLLAAFPSQDDATAAAQAVADFTDWTRSADDLRTADDIDLPAYYDRLMDRTNGLIIAR